MEHHTNQNHSFEQLPSGLQAAAPRERFVDSPYLVPFDGSFGIDSIPTSPPAGEPTDKQAKKLRKKLTVEIGEQQERLFAQNEYGVLTKLQGMDTSGKGGMIKSLTRDVNAAGTRVHSFKKPSDAELDRAPLWRVKAVAPERGLLTYYDRSDYEEVLVVRVHPEILNFQNLPDRPNDAEVFTQRYASILAEERDLAWNGFIVLKFWLNTSKAEQAVQLLERLDTPEKHWKLSKSDFEERKFWPEYREAAQQMMAHTSTPYAPWYCIPSDDKQYARYIAADITLRTLAKLNLSYPSLSTEDFSDLDTHRTALIEEIKAAGK